MRHHQYDACYASDSFFDFSSYHTSAAADMKDALEERHHFVIHFRAFWRAHGGKSFTCFSPFCSSHLCLIPPPTNCTRIPHGQCNHLDMCCKDMCHLLPLRGPTGFCRQITYAAHRKKCHYPRACLRNAPALNALTYKLKLHGSNASYCKCVSQGHNVEEHPFRRGARATKQLHWVRESRQSKAA